MAGSIATAFASPRSAECSRLGVLAVDTQGREHNGCWWSSRIRSCGAFLRRARVCSADAAAIRIESGVIKRQLVEGQWPGWQGGPAMVRVVPAWAEWEGRREHCCACASACANPLRMESAPRGSAIDGNRCTKFRERLRHECWVTGEKMNSRLQTIALGSNPKARPASWRS